MARRGMVATSNPLATQAGLAMLVAGGNAMDAAIAAHAALCVVEPFMTGMGGDLFALIHRPGNPTIAFNGTGRSPRAWTLEKALDRGHVDTWPAMPPIPLTGGEPIVVPGAVDAWDRLSREYGRLPLADLLAPAIHHAEEGFPVAPITARYWRQFAAVLRSAGAGGELFLPDGEPPVAGQIFTQPVAGNTLRVIAEGGCRDFYEGGMAQALIHTAQSSGSLMDLDDLAAHEATVHDPLTIDYRGFRVSTMPPNSQGLVALMALQTMSMRDFSSLEPGSLPLVHLQVESLRQAFTLGFRHIADPAFAPVPVDELLGPEAAQQRAAAINDQQAAPRPTVVPPASDTTYLATADGDGMAVSYIASLAGGFGSGVVCQELGIALNNRGAFYSLDPAHPNRLEGGKRPYHTLIPILVHRPDGSLHTVAGVVGGFMQPQGLVQVLQHLLDFGADPQQALDAPRACVVGGHGDIALEEGFPDVVARGLVSFGHRLVSEEQRTSVMFGGGQLITVKEHGLLIGASEPRLDGCAGGW